jgi:hypothetical protein
MRWWPDVAVALILAIIFAVIVGVIFEIFGVGARIREYLRELKAQKSARTIAQIQKRVSEKEKYRDTFVSDKALYLGVFRISLVMLTSMAAGWAVLILAHSWPFRDFFAGQIPLLNFWALFYFGLAVIGGIQGVRIAQHDTKAKSDQMVRKLDGEIESLKNQIKQLQQ